jgi:hypothetical protein
VQLAKARPTAESLCHTHSAYRPVSQPPKWQARTCDEQSVVGQIARRSRSSSAGRKSREIEGRPQRVQLAAALDPPPRAAATRTAHIGQCHSPQSARRVLGKSSLSSGRYQGVPARHRLGGRVVKPKANHSACSRLRLGPPPSPKSHCQTYSACRPVSQPSKWQVRTCEKQPIVR